MTIEEAVKDIERLLKERKTVFPNRILTLYCLAKDYLNTPDGLFPEKKEEIVHRKFDYFIEGLEHNQAIDEMKLRYLKNKKSVEEIVKILHDNQEQIEIVARQDRLEHCTQGMLIFLRTIGEAIHTLVYGEKGISDEKM